MTLMLEEGWMRRYLLRDCLLLLLQLEWEMCLIFEPIESLL